MEESNSNPMMNSVVLRNIFEMIPISDLKSCRQVCKPWYEESLTRWRRDMWLKLQEENSSNDALTLTNFLELSKANDSISDPSSIEKGTFKKFKLQGWHFNSENDELKTRFLKTYGPVMTHLEIEQSVFDSREDFESVVFQSFPKLQSLSLNGNSYKVTEEQIKIVPPINDVLSNANKMSSVKDLQLNLWTHDGAASFPLSYLEFFANYPNLKNLKLCRFPWRIPNELNLENLLRAMLTLSKNGGYSWALENFATFHMYGYSYSQVISLLPQLQFPLISLTLDIGCNTRPSDFKMILKTYANTLRKLVVYGSGHSLKLIEDNPDFRIGVQLKSLTELRLFETAASLNLNFLQFMPNLRSLFLVKEIDSTMLNAAPFLSDPDLLRDLHNRQKEYDSGNPIAVYPIPNTDFSQLRNTVLPGMEELVVFGKNNKVCTAKQIAALSRMMPNLKRLRVGLENDGFRVVCNAWKELEVLIIQPCEVNNSGITGTIPGLPIQLPNLYDLTRLRYFIKDTTAPVPPCTRCSRITDEALWQCTRRSPPPFPDVRDWYSEMF